MMGTETSMTLTRVNLEKVLSGGIEWEGRKQGSI